MSVNTYTSKRSGLTYYAGTSRFDETQRDFNAAVIANILMGYGWSFNAVCGILGNMQSESACNPGAYYGYTEYSATSFGLVQWDPTSKYENWADERGYTPYYDIEYQCERIKYEFENGLQYYSTDEYPISRSDFVTSNKTPYELACAFAWNYERSATVLNGTEAEKEELRQRRGGQAERFYTLLSSSNTNAEAIANAISWAVGIANDDTHGYDQDERWGPDYDCSSLLIQAYENAGIPVKQNGATATSNMRSAFVKTGFTQYSYSDVTEFLAGDVLWRDGHCAMYIGDGQIVSAHINELGEVTGGVTGDQTGHEIDVSSFSSSGNWEYVLRLPSSGSVTPPSPPTPTPTYRKHVMSKLLLYASAMDWF